MTYTASTSTVVHRTCMCQCNSAKPHHHHHRDAKQDRLMRRRRPRRIHRWGRDLGRAHDVNRATANLSGLSHPAPLPPSLPSIHDPIPILAPSKPAPRSIPDWRTGLDARQGWSMDGWKAPPPLRQPKLRFHFCARTHARGPRWQDWGLSGMDGMGKDGQSHRCCCWLARRRRLPSVHPSSSCRWRRAAPRTSRLASPRLVPRCPIRHAVRATLRAPTCFHAHAARPCRCRRQCRSSVYRNWSQQVARFHDGIDKLRDSLARIPQSPSACPLAHNLKRPRRLIQLATTRHSRHLRPL